MVLFLASLPEEEYQVLLHVFEKYESFDIKGQKISRTQRGKSRFAKLDCKGGYSKPLRGIDEETRTDLLEKLKDEDLSFQELASSCKYAKKMRDVQYGFMKYLDIPSWNIALERFPEHTKSKLLEPFLELSFKSDNVPASFVSFCQHAKQSTEVRVADNSDSGANKVVHIGSVLASILKMY